MNELLLCDLCLRSSNITNIKMIMHVVMDYFVMIVVKHLQCFALNFIILLYFKSYSISVEFYNRKYLYVN